MYSSKSTCTQRNRNSFGPLIQIPCLYSLQLPCFIFATVVFSRFCLTLNVAKFTLRRRWFCSQYIHKCSIHVQFDSECSGFQLHWNFMFENTCTWGDELGRFTPVNLHVDVDNEVRQHFIKTTQAWSVAVPSCIFKIDINFWYLHITFISIRNLGY